jgi:hypothetical protein
VTKRSSGLGQFECNDYRIHNWRHVKIKNETMIENWFIVILLVLVTIAVIILVIKKNQKDRKDLFKKLPGDYPDPKKVESEFDSVNKKNRK